VLCHSFCSLVKYQTFVVRCGVCSQEIDDCLSAEAPQYFQ